MIQSFQDEDTAELFQARTNRRWRNIELVACRKLDMLSAAAVLTDLRIPPANRLEKLSGNRNGQHSIRINDQYRICFVWGENGPYNVEITDYH
jgi:toxin HigB-1